MPDDVWKVNPRLVYAKGHGQGQRGPDADLGGFDSVCYWSRGGVGDILTAPGAPLVMPRGAIGDAPSGAMLAGGMAAALFDRERTGKGVVVDVSLLATAVWQLSTDLTATAVLRKDPKRLSAGKTLANPMVGPYRAADDRWLMLNMLDDVRHWPPLCRALGLEALIEDPRFADSESRRTNAEELHDALHRRDQRTDASGDRCRARRGGHDVLDDGVAARGGRRPAGRRQRLPRAAPHRARARLAAAPMQFDDEITEVKRAAPALSEHTDEVLTEVGCSAAEIEALRTAGAVA